jgi:hypothetical protein
VHGQSSAATSAARLAREHRLGVVDAVDVALLEQHRRVVGGDEEGGERMVAGVHRPPRQRWARSSSASTCSSSARCGRRPGFVAFVRHASLLALQLLAQAPSSAPCRSCSSAARRRSGTRAAA